LSFQPSKRPFLSAISPDISKIRPK
jgi:hypothetical protein